MRNWPSYLAVIWDDFFCDGAREPAKLFDVPQGPQLALDPNIADALLNLAVLARLHGNTAESARRIEHELRVCIPSAESGLEALLSQETQLNRSGRWRGVARDRVRTTRRRCLLPLSLGTFHFGVAQSPPTVYFHLRTRWAPLFSWAGWTTHSCLFLAVLGCFWGSRKPVLVGSDSRASLGYC